jgi:HD-GYP domain-containing protein (c-di-GMP phosphodiesterase class II)
MAREVRVAELLALLSLGADLGAGLPMEHVMRQTIIAMRLADLCDLRADERPVVYYASHLAWVGCHIDAYEQAKWFGDDLALKHDFRFENITTIRGMVGGVLRHVAAGRPALDRLRTSVALFTGGMREVDQMLMNHCYSSNHLARQLGMPDEVCLCISQTFERWDGRGPGKVKGDEASLAGRVVCLADVVEVYHRAMDIDAAVAVARERSGTQFDPALVEVFAANAAECLDGLDDMTTEDFVAAEPPDRRTIPEHELDGVLEAIADFVDLKSPYTIGHSRAVAELSRDAAPLLGASQGEISRTYRAGLLHDIGRLGVSNAIWDKPGPLSQTEMERVRLHPYLTERMLASCPALAHLAAPASQHHERLDGTGYPNGLSGEALSTPARIIAAADAYRAKIEPRPHRDAMTPDDAAAYSRDEARAGRLDGSAVDAVLTAAGHRTPRQPSLPAGLTQREVDVLRLLAAGLSSKEIAKRLVISPKTARNHTEHIYTKIGVSNRALASLYAVRNGLISEPIV